MNRGRVAEDVIEDAELLQNCLPRGLKQDTRADGPECGRSFEDGDAMPIASEQVSRRGPRHAAADHRNTIRAIHAPLPARGRLRTRLSGITGSTCLRQLGIDS
jgi:hypothetical protein